MGAATGVSLVWVRPAACLLPKYRVKMWAKSRRKFRSDGVWRDTMLAAYEVSSSASPASIELGDVTYLGVPASYCVEPSMVRFWIRIKKDIVSA